MLSGKMSGKLIKAVEAHPPLYHVAYKGKKALKVAIWEEIAKELKLPNGVIAKNKWRNIKDSYRKYLRHCSEKKTSDKDTTPSSSRKLAKWVWAPKLAFLKPHLSTIKNLKLPTSDDPSALQQNDITSINEQIDENSADCYSFNDIKSETLSVHLDEITDSADDFDHQIHNNNETTALNTTLPIANNITDINNDIDLLFSSYAQTLKKFSQRRQIEIKMQIATIFYEAELQELEQLHQK